MPPKKKGNKASQDDWEAELGEPIAPAASASSNNAIAEAKGENKDEAGGAGGLMAMLRKNKEKRKKKGLQDKDFVTGEDPPGFTSAAAESTKAPEEASTQEFALPNKKAKEDGKAKQSPKKDKPDDVEDGAEFSQRRRRKN